MATSETTALFAARSISTRSASTLPPNACSFTYRTAGKSSGVSLRISITGPPLVVAMVSRGISPLQGCVLAGLLPKGKHRPSARSRGLYACVQTQLKEFFWRYLNAGIKPTATCRLLMFSYWATVPLLDVGVSKEVTVPGWMTRRPGLGRDRHEVRALLEVEERSGAGPARLSPRR